MGIPDPVPAHKTDNRWLDDDVDIQPRPRDDLVAGLMEARDCSKPAAKRYLAMHGAVHCEHVLLNRWA